ncbi:Uncharacterised protein [Mycobacteroides abscessus subsp. abscessus]|uniref:hypothetical protein n=1 Tax=Mycobacteroides abscessus TaxID=36809 RepID=UPI000929753A|nr:hypothetical protein [Mycobacteroides abscessus]MBE5513754.1 hypothetical protein [Mycobacteroides abscessus]MBN7327699.1 hypothetical protein [Mycobacteroides abscessus subsp. abscessus]SID62308.1 Uncharacterised protein [Mycobacteroides abscessus subsp. abscessus]SIE83332.1 Uncharacterised protein [Mycobacteroides abscessus subsp. abscessus]SIF72519.1 Uncharacterised protein [Mycobacteroides abscessus subsp. abscessus]
MTLDPVTYVGHRARVVVDPAAGTVTVTPARGGQPWTVPLSDIEAVGVRYSTLIKRGTLRLLVKGQAWADITDGSPNAVGQAHMVARGVDDDPIAFAAALERLGIPTVPLDGKGRAAKVREPGWLDGLDLSGWS